MLKREITYIDFDGEPQTDTYYFHLSRTELTEMEAKMEGGMIAFLQKIVDTHDTSTMFDVFKDIVIRSVGVKSEDGKAFIKKPDFAEAFVYSAAFDALFMDLASDALRAADFIIALLPSDLAEKVEADDAFKAATQEVVESAREAK